MVKLTKRHEGDIYDTEINISKNRYNLENRNWDVFLYLLTKTIFFDTD